MPSKKNLMNNKRQLIHRYLIWCYKTTKESLDRIDRKFTQLKVDDYIFDKLKKRGINKQCPIQFNEFEKYIGSKRAEAHKQKFVNASSQKLLADYQYLSERLLAVEKAIGYFLGRRALASIVDLYEREMTRRILEAREER